VTAPRKPPRAITPNKTLLIENEPGGYRCFCKVCGYEDHIKLSDVALGDLLDAAAALAAQPERAQPAAQGALVERLRELKALAFKSADATIKLSDVALGDLLDAAAALAAQPERAQPAGDVAALLDAADFWKCPHNPERGRIDDKLVRVVCRECLAALTSAPQPQPPDATLLARFHRRPESQSGGGGSICPFATCGGRLANQCNLGSSRGLRDDSAISVSFRCDRGHEWGLYASDLAAPAAQPQDGLEAVREEVEGLLAPEYRPPALEALRAVLAILARHRQAQRSDAAEGKR
jgi:hypothetical protein